MSSHWIDPGKIRHKNFLINYMKMCLGLKNPSSFHVGKDSNGMKAPNVSCNDKRCRLVCGEAESELQRYKFSVSD